MVKEMVEQLSEISLFVVVHISLKYGVFFAIVCYRASIAICSRIVTKCFNTRRVRRSTGVPSDEDIVRDYMKEY